MVDFTQQELIEGEREAGRRACERDIFYLGTFVLSNHFSLASPGFHREIISKVEGNAADPPPHI